MSTNNNRRGNKNNNNNGASMNVRNNGIGPAAAAAGSNSRRDNKGSNGSNSNSQGYKSLAGLDKIIKMYTDNKKKYLEESKLNKAKHHNYYSLMSEIHLHLYLIYSGYRNVAEIKIDEVPREKVIDVSEYLTENEINFGITDSEPRKPLVNGFLKLCVPGVPGTCKNDASRGVDVADELGDFYTCKAEKDKWDHYQWRIVIICDRSIDLFAQMCPKDGIIDSMKTVTKVYEDLSALFIKLDKPRFEAFPVNPLKISIYKVYKPKAGAAGGK